LRTINLLRPLPSRNGTKLKNGLSQINKLLNITDCVNVREISFSFFTQTSGSESTILPVDTAAFLDKVRRDFG
jgi:hypothetical protein